MAGDNTEPNTTEKSATSAFISEDLKLSVYIPSDLVGKVIGKKGIVVTNIKRETHVSIITAMKPVGSSSWTPVVILGSFQSICDAYKAVATIVDDEVDDVILEFNLVRGKHAYLITGGNNNLLIRKLSAETNVRIFIPGSNSHPQAVTMEGEFDNVKRAYDLLVTLHNNPELQADWCKISKQTSTTPTPTPTATATTATTHMKPSVSTTSNSHPVSTTSVSTKKISTPTVTNTEIHEKKVGGIKVTTTAPITIKKEIPIKAPLASITIKKGTTSSTTTTTTSSGAASTTTSSIVAKEKGKKILSALNSPSDMKKDTTGTTAAVAKSKADTAVEKSKQAIKEKVTTIKSEIKANEKKNELVVPDKIEHPADNIVLAESGTPGRPPRTIYEKSINIPATLVGLLLARRPESTIKKTKYINPNASKNVINQIQGLTHTIISRTSGPKKYVKPTTSVTSPKVEGESAKSTTAGTTGKDVDIHDNDDDDDDKKKKLQDKRRRRRHNDDDDEEEEDEEDSEEEEDDESEESEDEEHEEHHDESNTKHVVSSVIDEKLITPVEKLHLDSPDDNAVSPEGVSSTSPTDEAGHINTSNDELVTFKVSGTSEKNVDFAIDHINMIIAGDRIKDVMIKLKETILKEYPPKRPSYRSSYYDKKEYTGRSIRDSGRSHNSADDDEDDDEDDEDEDDDEDEEDEGDDVSRDEQDYKKSKSYYNNNSSGYVKSYKKPYSKPYSGEKKPYTSTYKKPFVKKVYAPFVPNYVKKSSE